MNKITALKKQVELNIANIMMYVCILNYNYTAWRKMTNYIIDLISQIINF